MRASDAIRCASAPAKCPHHVCRVLCRNFAESYTADFISGGLTLTIFQSLRCVLGSLNFSQSPRGAAFQQSYSAQPFAQSPSLHGVSVVHADASRSQNTITQSLDSTGQPDGFIGTRWRQSCCMAHTIAPRRSRYPRRCCRHKSTRGNRGLQARSTGGHRGCAGGQATAQMIAADAKIIERAESGQTRHQPVNGFDPTSKLFMSNTPVSKAIESVS